MSPAQSHSLNEAAVPIPENLFGQMAQAEPKDAVEIAKKLPLANRARLAAFCYGRRHLNHLGLLIASTCDRMSLRRAMGMAGDVVFQQSRNVEETLAAEGGRGSDASKITLAKAANVVPLRRAVKTDDGTDVDAAV
ncbi:MAG: hypothetical protein AAGM04_03845 [Pseudomonadota bacterium]